MTNAKPELDSTSLLSIRPITIGCNDMTTPLITVWTRTTAMAVIATLRLPGPGPDALTTGPI